MPGLAKVTANCAEAREDARDVAVEDRILFPKRDAENCRGGVVPDARQRENVFQAGWKLSTMFRDDLLSGFLQVARATVIPEAGPQAQHFFLRRSGERANVWKALQEIFVVRDHCRNARLLQHDFREPDAIGIFGAAPRQIALELMEPASSCLRNVARSWP